jgi:REP element-mobilizing transposase RayT
MCGKGKNFNPELYHRRSIRLKHYDYSQPGFYFITICTQNKLKFFGEVKHGEMRLNDAGRMVEMLWQEIPKYYRRFNIREFIVMPNHIHGIIEIKHDFVGADPCVCPKENKDIPGGMNNNSIRPVSASTDKIKMSLSEIVQRFKTLTTRKYIDGVKLYDWPAFNKRLWQRNYYEHIIRNENSYLKIAEYIINNPKTWEKDEYFW